MRDVVEKLVQCRFAILSLAMSTESLFLNRIGRLSKALNSLTRTDTGVQRPFACSRRGLYGKV